MSKRVYISADYDPDSGDRSVVDELNKWGGDNYHRVDFTDMAKVVSGSVSMDSDCRICDLKREFNAQINASSFVVFVVGDKTAKRTAGSKCERWKKSQDESCCTPYKQNAVGVKRCRVSIILDTSESDDVGDINGYSYLYHEFKQAQKRNKNIIVLYNSMRKEPSWLPLYLKDFEDIAQPFWIKDALGHKTGNYAFIKEKLGF